MRNIARGVKKFINTESSGGIILFLFAILAVVVANSNFAPIYYDFFSIALPLNLPFLSIYKEMNLKLWVDDGLMAIFFLLVGLELKREVVVGEFSSKSKIIIPFLAALGGAAVPMLIYYFINFDYSQNIRGIAIPAATDIAFAIGVLSLFGKKVSHSLKVFLVALAIIDDLIAIIIIALFYSSNIDLGYLVCAFLTILLLGSFNAMNIVWLFPYLLVAPFLWVFVLKSGIHPTIAGVILAFFIPLSSKNNDSSNKLKISPAKFLEHILHFPVSYLILPIFAFANSGIALDNFSLEILTDKIVLGIVFGLFFGKQIGIFLTVYLLYKFRICQFFKNASWLEFYGISLLAGIGFTMSLFIGNLAFVETEIIDKARVGIIFGSLLSAICGVIILKIATRHKKNGLLAS